MSIKITHNAGFFSCCSVRLSEIVKYINANDTLPMNVDSSEQFSWYHKSKSFGGDITFQYFEDYNKIPNPPITSKIDYSHVKQYSDYSKLEYEKICSIVEKYFTPSKEIKDFVCNMESKYNLNYENTCVLFYRGNDKNRETQICGYEEYIKYSDEILKKYPNTRFLIQSDETEFIELIQKTYPSNSFYMKDEIRHMKKCNSTVDKVMKNQNHVFSKYYLGITIMMSKCKFIVCGTGNCSIWIMLYRGNSNGLIQNRANEWIREPA